MRIIPIIVLFACLTWQTQGLAQDDSEARPVPPRGLLKRGLLAKGKTTTTTTPLPQEEVEYDEEDYAADGDVVEPSTEAPSSSTEGKKLVAGGVRPFRSNTDLLEALKRRRAQVAEAKLHGHSSTTATSQESGTEAPAKSSFSKKRVSAPKESNNDEVPAAPVKPSRNRFGRPSSRSYQEPEAEEQSNDAAPTRVGRGFPRRGGN